MVTINLNTIEKIKRFITMALTFDSDINVSLGHYTVDGKSALGMFSLDVSNPLQVQILSADEREFARFIKEMEEFK